MKSLNAISFALFFALTVAGCSGGTNSDTLSSTDASTSDTSTTDISNATISSTTNETSETNTVTATQTAVADSFFDGSSIFTERDLSQTADTTNATLITVESNTDISITEEGVYVISGEASQVTITVDADQEAKIQMVLDGVTITNTDSPAIDIKSADKVFVTTTDKTSDLEVTGSYVTEDETNLDAVIFSKADLVLNGTGILSISSTNGNGITSKDDLIITGGTVEITAGDDGLEANDLLAIYDGDLTIEAKADGMHSENDEDDTQGSIYIAGGIIQIQAQDDGIRATSVVQIDGGTITIPTSTEAIEGTYLQLNGGTIDVYGSDDGLNATSKSSSYDVVIEINGGELTVEVGSGDTDAIDANGSIYVNGGTINVTANSAFDYDNTAELNGGSVIINNETVTEIPESAFGGGGNMGGKGMIGDFSRP